MRSEAVKAQKHSAPAPGTVPPPVQEPLTENHNDHRRDNGRSRNNIRQAAQGGGLTRAPS